jgi:holo-[acyl-carrier protein] synthase
VTVIGIGTDIVEIARLAHGLERFGRAYAGRILSPEELLSFPRARNQVRFLALRFAAKEAVAKAFGTGFRDGLGLRQIGVTHDRKGKPGLRYHGRAAELADALGVTESHLSLADERAYAIAFVTLVAA